MSAIQWRSEMDNEAIEIARLNLQRIENEEVFIHSSSKVENIKQGELIKRKEDAKYCFVRGEYCRESKTYGLISWDGKGEPIYVKKGTVLFTDWDTTNED